MSRRTSGGPIWVQPAPGTRRPRFSRERIAEVALAIADAEGFDAVSMRRIADELGAGTMTLYHYVRTKDDLLALMDDALAGEVVLAEVPAGWRAGIRAIACASRAAFLRHPWALIATRGARMGPNAMRHVEQSMAALATTGLAPELQIAIGAIVDDYVYGNVLRAPQIEVHHGRMRAAREVRSFLREQLATGAYPTLARMTGDDDPMVAFERFMSAMTDDARFEAGLDMLLDGIAARYGLTGVAAAAEVRPTAAEVREPDERPGRRRRPPRPPRPRPRGR